MIRHSYNFEDLTAQVFDRWTVLKQALNNKNSSRVFWVCKCTCGTIRNVDASSLKQGITRSCGCLRSEIAKINGKKRKTHGMSKTKFYRTWRMMIKRCRLISDKDYHNYGGRGIMVCDRWLGKDGFIHFKEDMWESYLNHVVEFGEDNTSIDRINNDLLINGYSKNNCKWATVSEQRRNTRTSAKTENYEEHMYWKLRLIANLGKAVKRNSRSKLLEPYLGCTIPEFREHIESQFTEGMNWDNHGQGKGKWQFDHVIGCNNFDLSLEKDRQECFNYKNTRPMWYKDHIKKSVARGGFQWLR